MSVRTALDAIVGVVSAVSGIRQAPTNPTDNPSIYPFAVCYVMDGQLVNGAMGTRKHLVNIAIELLTARKDGRYRVNVRANQCHITRKVFSCGQ